MERLEGADRRIDQNLHRVHLGDPAAAQPLPDVHRAADLRDRHEQTSVTRTTLPPRFSVPSLFPQLAGMARETVRLHPAARTGARDRCVEARAVRCCGPQTLAWPICTLPHPTMEFQAGAILASFKPSGNPYVGVLQLRRKDVPELGFPGDADLFHLLWCSE